MTGKELDERNARIVRLHREDVPPTQIARREGVSRAVVAKVLRRAGERLGWPEFAKARGYESTWR